MTSITIEDIRKRPILIMSVENPSQEMIDEAVTYHHALVKWFDPSPKVLLDVIKASYGEIAPLVRRFDETIHMTIINYKAELFPFLKNPNEEAVREAIKKLPENLIHVEKQTDELCRIAIKSGDYALDYVIDLTDDLILFAIRNHGFTVCEYLHEISLPIYEELFQYPSPYICDYVSSVHEDIILDMPEHLRENYIRIFPNGVFWLNNPTEDEIHLAITLSPKVILNTYENSTVNGGHMLEAVRRDPSIYNRLRNPTEKVTMLWNMTK